jgi:hypothetical protein
MTEWNLHIFYGAKEHKLKAVLEYESNQIMRISVAGKNSTILLENNYPLLKHLNPHSKRALKWLLREGTLTGDKLKNAAFLSDIMGQLEQYIKADLPLISKTQQIQQKKSW